MAVSVLATMGKVANEVISFIVFILLDLLDFILCYAYRVADFWVESEWNPCYCSSATGGGGGGKILVSEKGESKIVSLSSSEVQLDEISDTLYARSSLVSEIRRRMKEGKTTAVHRPSTVTVNSAVVEMIQGRMEGQKCHVGTRWSDCDCSTCTCWTSSCKETLFVRTEGAKDYIAREDVLFIHGLISSSAFWTETLFPNLSKSVRSKYRLIAVDLLGFGRSPKPNDSLYTLREHLDMIQTSVFEKHKVKSFHIVAHSLGCLLALALAVKHSDSVKSLTLIAPPYFPTPKGERATQYTMRRVAPRRVWPPMAFGASLACWYEHITRTFCLLVCKNHRFLEFLIKFVTQNRIRTYLIECFFCHTHNAAWHTLHNIICGTANKIEGYLDAVKNNLKCSVTIFHGTDDELIPVECSHNVQSRIPRARVKVIEKKDHITIVVGRQKAFARELEEIWRNSSG